MILDRQEIVCDGRHWPVSLLYLEDRLIAVFAGAHADHVLHGQDRDLAVPDITGPADFDNHVHKVVHLRVGTVDLYLDLGQDKIIVRPACLRAEPPHIGYRHAPDAGGSKLVFQFLKLFRPDDALNHCALKAHRFLSGACAAWKAA